MSPVCIGYCEYMCLFLLLRNLFPQQQNCAPFVCPEHKISQSFGVSHNYKETLILWNLVIGETKIKCSLGLGDNKIECNFKNGNMDIAFFFKESFKYLVLTFVV